MKGLCVVVASLCAVALAVPWDSNNDPTTFSNATIVSFKALQQRSASLAVSPWSDTYWPDFQGGISHRWNSQTPKDFGYSTLSLATLKRATWTQLSQLSPAEKLDIYAGRYDYPTVKSEWQRCSPQDPTWTGLCHGWAPASMAYLQPYPVNLTNKDGILVPFGSSDVKALLTYFVAQYEDGFSSTEYVS
jgi:hypothetical protein